MPTAPDEDSPHPQHVARHADDEAGAHGVRPPHAHLTSRGSLAVTLLGVLVVLALIGLALHLAHSHHHADAAPAAGAASSASSTPSGATTAPSSVVSSPDAASQASSSASTPSALPAGATRDSRGYVHSNYASSGHFASSTSTMAPRHRTATVHTFIVEVETSLPKANAQLAPNTVAAEVASVLNDPRGWTGMRSGIAKGVSFQLVNNPRKAQFVIHLATAQTVNRMCPLDTIDLWSCDAGGTVLLNADRWLYATPFYPSVEEYREYQVNHEVGHFLGFGHQYTCGRGGMAPTMMQQSKGLHGCRANPWPTVA